MTLDALDASERRYRLIVEASPAPMAVHRGGQLVYANAAAAKLVGAESPEALIGRPVLDFVHPDYRDAVVARTRRAQVDGQPSPTLEEQFLTLDGRTIDVEVTAIPVPYEGEPASLVVIRDITRQKAHEQADRRLALLAEASATLISAVERRTLLPAILDLSSQLFDASGYAVWRSDASGSWRIEAAAGLSESYMQSALAAFTGTESTTAWTVAAGDVDHEPALARNRAGHRAEGIRALLAVPLRIHGVDSGSITFYWRQPRHFPDAELRAATALANLAGAAIGTAELYESSRLAERHVRAMAEASRGLAAASLSEDAVYQVLVKQAALLLGDACAVGIVSEDEDHLLTPAVYHADPEALQLLRHLLPGMSASRPWRETLTGQVAHTGQAVRRDGLSPAAVREVVPSHLWPYADRYPIRSLMIVPLGVEGRTFGALVLSRMGHSPPYTDDDQALAQDLADRAALAIDNAVLYRRAQQAIRARDEFLSIASHELRTPVTALKAVAQLLQRALARGPLEPGRLERALQQIDDGSRRLAALTEDLLDVSRLQTGRFELRLEAVDLGALARQFAEGSLEQLEGRLVLIETQPDCVVRADPARLEQVLGNLLSNAAKYSPEGQQIELRVQHDSSGVLLEVEDHGIGLPPGAEETIFQPFGRGANAARRQIQGLGLGLYICREIVERHSGRIWATSRGEGQGTTLHVWVPRS